MITIVFLVSCLILAVAYLTYGGWLEKQFRVDNDNLTPSHSEKDGIDFIPTADPILFGHHFSSIAGAGPIVGPIVAGLAFGWFPALLWILVGSILVGGVHDYSALIASIRHKGQSIGQICKQYLRPFTYRTFLIFIWFTLVYVLIVFLDLTAGTFAPSDSARAATGGAVATSAVLYIIIALLFGLTVYRGGVKLGKASLIFVPLVFAALWVGIKAPLLPDYVPAIAGSPKNTWSLILLVYCFVASIAPVWILLQPRDYLSSFLLYACLGGGAIGLVISGLTGHVTMEWPFFNGWIDPKLGFIFPALFITVACGAVSGFHSIVASGTTSKQLDTEKGARRIAYGGMLVEAVLGLVALSTVMILSKSPTGQSPVAVFGQGVGTFLVTLGIPSQVAAVFALLAVSTFLLTTLDTCTRLARFIVQELLGIENWTGRILGTAISLAIPAIVVFLKIPGPGGTPMPAWKAIWPAFGACNQLMAALALLVVFTWLRSEGRKTIYIVLPMLFMFITTLTALARLVRVHLFQGGSLFVGSVSLMLGLLALLLIGDTILMFKTKRPIVA